MLFLKNTCTTPAIRKSIFHAVGAWFFFFVETFRSFWSLKHLGHLSHSCIKTHHKSVFSAYIFKHSDRNDLFFLVISKTFWPMTEKKPQVDALTVFY